MYVCVFFAFKIINPILLYTVTPVLGNRQVHLCSHSMYNWKKKKKKTTEKTSLIFAENSDFISSFHSMNLKEEIGYSVTRNALEISW